ncbi:Ras GTPase tem1 [Mucor velutinosus]|uniref:Ras GTPase tem1 n=1 Tax=Mucor velutinosus TaxID=708070 RepID=A0AAN7HWA3_9FUNG|nr:Ras GTPase tem1 [Mucor velutinosus]
MKAAIITSLLFVAAVVAQTTAPFYLTSPIVGTTYKAGSTVTITWTNGVDESAQVSLLTGTNAATMHPTGDTFTIKGSDGEYNWKVPSDLPQNATFSFKIDYTDSKGVAGSTYSSGFTITGTTGDVVSQSFVSSIATAVSSAASSAVPSASSSAITSSSIRPSSTSSVPQTSSAATTSATVSASTTPQAPSAASGFKAPTVAICAIVIIASALFF